MAAAREQVGVCRGVRSSRPLVVAGLLALAACTAAHAGPVRCTGADGKVVYSDQPCAQGQTAAEVKGVPAGGPSSTTATGASSGGGDTVRASSPSVQDVQNKAQRDRVHASLSPECRALGDRASRSVQSDSSASMEEVKRAVSQFEDKCGDQVMEATRKENARGGGKNSKPDAATCRSLREALSADRARLGRMTDKEKMAFVAQQNEVSVACP